MSPLKKTRYCFYISTLFLFLVYIAIYQKIIYKSNLLPKWLSKKLSRTVNHEKIANIRNGKFKPFIILFWTPWYGTPVDDEDGLASLFKLCEKEFFITSEKSLYDIADVIIFQLMDVGDVAPPKSRKPDQPWILASQEAAIHRSLFNPEYSLNGLFNWTWSIRGDSTFSTRFTDAFEKYEEKDDKWIYGSDFSLEFLRNKTKLGAWTVSNCRLEPSQRNSLMDNLKNHGLAVDIYGKCGNNSCKENCFESLGLSYKFYFALENALCHEYITEKIYHGFVNGMVPVVYALGDIARVAPKNSFINILDFPTVAALAKYLQHLDKDPRAYFKYFEWRSVWNISTGTVKYQCEIPLKVKAYVEDVKQNKDKSVYRHVYQNLDEWYYKFYNPNFNKLCEICLDESTVSTSEPVQNKMKMYFDRDRCK